MTSSDFTWTNLEGVDVPGGAVLPGTRIEIIRRCRAPQARAVLFDFDGTLSLVRSGWVDVMVPMMVEVLLELGTGESREELESIVREFVARLTGKQTIYQMIELAEQVKKRGGNPLEPLQYKHRYLDRLWGVIKDRIAGLGEGRIPPEEMLVPGSRAILEAFRARGLRMYVASGTDEVYARREAELLGVTPFLDAEVYGAIDDYKSYSKRMVIHRIITAHGIREAELVGFGDGYVEIEDVKAVKGCAVGVATDEPSCHDVNQWKRRRLILAGADAIIPNYLECDELVRYLLESEGDQSPQ